MLSKLIALVSQLFRGKREVSVTEMVDRQVNRDVDALVSAGAVEVVAVEAVQPIEPQPKKPFVFAESLAAYQTAVLADRVARQAAQTAFDEKIASLKQGVVDGDVASKAGGDSASDELARRAGQTKAQKARSAIEKEYERRRKEEYGWKRVSLFEDEVRSEDNDRVAHEGQILLQLYEEPKEGPSQMGIKVERRLVRLLDGRIYSCHIEYSATMRGTGRTTKVRCGYGDRTVPTYEPTGEYGAPTVKWVTSSKQSFKNEELVWVAQDE